MNITTRPIFQMLNFEAMEPIRITAVKYYNTLPFIFGLTRSGLPGNIDLSLDVPSECARKLQAGEADLGLIPVGALPSIPGYTIVSRFCIGAVKNVQSVILISNTELRSLRKIYLDTDSRTSVALVKILAEELWKINVTWESSANLKDSLKSGEGMVAIGDKTFELRGNYQYSYDLAGEWIRLTGLPFVFAVWVATKQLPEQFLNDFESALSWGVEHKQGSVSLATNLIISEEELHIYLDKAIHYPLDDEKHKGMELFLSKLKKISR